MTPPSRGGTISLRSSPARAQSLLARKVVLRKHLKAIRLLNSEPPDESGNESSPELDIEWLNWDRDSIASEITSVENCDILQQHIVLFCTLLLNYHLNHDSFKYYKKKLDISFSVTTDLLDLPSKFI